MASDDEIDPAAVADIYRQAYAAGNKLALWQAIIYCAAHRRPPWNWLSDRLLQIDNDREVGALESFDDALGRPPWGEGRKGGARTRARKWEIYNRITDARNKVAKSKTELDRARADAKAAAARREIAARPDSEEAPEVASAAQAEANKTLRKAERALREAKKAEQEAWGQFGMSKKSAERLFYSVERAVRRASTCEN